MTQVERYSNPWLSFANPWNHYLSVDHMKAVQGDDAIISVVLNHAPPFDRDRYHGVQGNLSFTAERPQNILNTWVNSIREATNNNEPAFISGHEHYCSLPKKVRELLTL